MVINKRILLLCVFAVVFSIISCFIIMAQEYDWGSFTDEDYAGFDYSKISPSEYPYMDWSKVPPADYGNIQWDQVPTDSYGKLDWKKVPQGKIPANNVKFIPEEGIDIDAIEGAGNAGEITADQWAYENNLQKCNNLNSYANAKTAFSDKYGVEIVDPLSGYSGTLTLNNEGRLVNTVGGKSFALNLPMEELDGRGVTPLANGGFRISDQFSEDEAVFSVFGSYPTMKYGDNEFTFKKSFASVEIRPDGSILLGEGTSYTFGNMKVLRGGVWVDGQVVIENKYSDDSRSDEIVITDNPALAKQYADSGVAVIYTKEEIIRDSNRYYRLTYYNTGTQEIVVNKDGLVPVMVENGQVPSGEGTMAWASEGKVTICNIGVSKGECGDYITATAVASSDEEDVPEGPGAGTAPARPEEMHGSCSSSCQKNECADQCSLRLGFDPNCVTNCVNVGTYVEYCESECRRG